MTSGRFDELDRRPYAMHFSSYQPLSFALQQEYVGAVRFLLQEGADSEHHHLYRWCSTACERDNVELIRALLDHLDADALSRDPLSRFRDNITEMFDESAWYLSDGCKVASLLYQRCPRQDWLEKPLRRRLLEMVKDDQSEPLKQLVAELEIDLGRDYGGRIGFACMEKAEYDDSQTVVEVLQTLGARHIEAHNSSLSSA